jgi:hypothetical protein
VRKADNLLPYCAVVTKCGNLNFLEPSGPVTGLIYLYLFLPVYICNISRSVLRTKNVCTDNVCTVNVCTDNVCTDNIYTDNQNAHFIFNSFFFENRAVYDVIQKKCLELYRPQMTIWRIA